MICRSISVPWWKTSPTRYKPLALPLHCHKGLLSCLCIFIGYLITVEFFAIPWPGFISPRHKDLIASWKTLQKSIASQECESVHIRGKRVPNYNFNKSFNAERGHREKREVIHTCVEWMTTILSLKGALLNALNNNLILHQKRRFRAPENQSRHSAIRNNGALESFELYDMLLPPISIRITIAPTTSY